jgi:hypothetical protein
MIFPVVFKFGYMADHSPGYAEGWSEGIGLIPGSGFTQIQLCRGARLICASCSASAADTGALGRSPPGARCWAPLADHGSASRAVRRVSGQRQPSKP